MDREELGRTEVSAAGTPAAGPSRPGPGGQAGVGGSSMELLVNSIVDYAIFSLDADGRVASWSAGAERIKGYRAEEIIGRPFEVFYPPEAQAAGHPRRVLSEAARQGRFEEEGWRVRKDGSRFWASVVVTALHDREGRLVGFGKVTRDLTERKAAEDKLRDALRRLEESQAQMARQVRLAGIGELAAAISHELRNPLGVIANALYLIRNRLQELGDPRLLGPVDLAEREVRSATRIVSELLDFARSRPHSPIPVLVTQLVEDAVAVVPAPAGVGLSQSVEPDLVALVDPDPLRQVLVNLITNAYEACEEGDRVTVSGRAGPDGRVELEITDTGAGMGPETAQRAFEPFFTGKAHGTGLGLAVVRRIIDTHGGDIRIDSEIGRGTTVTIELPGRDRS